MHKRLSLMDCARPMMFSKSGSQNNQLSMFAKQLAYMLAQITDGAARAIVRNEDTENGFEIWRRCTTRSHCPRKLVPRIS